MKGKMEEKMSVRTSLGPAGSPVARASFWGQEAVRPGLSVEAKESGVPRNQEECSHKRFCMSCIVLHVHLH